MSDEKQPEMVERVAMAIWTLRNSTPEQQAKAAIKAMREPTEAMLDAAATVEHDAQPGEEWGPMIEAALK